jgi:hypothetical protein
MFDAGCSTVVAALHFQQSRWTRMEIHGIKIFDCNIRLGLCQLEVSSSREQRNLTRRRCKLLTRTSMCDCQLY